MKRIVSIFVLPALLMLGSCDKINPDPQPESGKYDRVFIVCGLGFNSLSYDIRANFEDLIGTAEKSAVPVSGSGKALLLFEHTVSDGYSTPTPPHIISVYRDFLGRPVRDTILTMESGSRLTEKDILKKGLEYIVSEYPSDHYGMLMSSHGSGWLPEGYYRSGDFASGLSAAPSSFGEEVVQTGTKKTCYEMDVTELRDAIPMHLDYLLFDACLMGGVEVAYELRDRTDAIGFSVTEVLTGGFDYSRMASRLLGDDAPDPEGVCRDYFAKYENSSATITFLKTSGLEDLASVCKELFARYRSGMAGLGRYEAQYYFRISTRPYFYDLLDLLDKSGASDEDWNRLKSAIDSCITYKATTPQFLSIPISRFCGLSMYLPNMGNTRLDNFYRYYAWNEATELVK